MPGATCVLLIEKAAVRTSTDATLLLATIVPSNHVPGRSVSVENHMRTIRGGAFGVVMGAVGSACGALLETLRFGGTASGLDEHAFTQQSAPITNVESALWKGFRSESKDDSRYMKLMDLLSPRAEAGPSLPRLDVVVEPLGSPSRLDWLATFAGLWIMTGLFIDAHQHLFLAVESFL